MHTPLGRIRFGAAALALLLLLAAGDRAWARSASNTVSVTATVSANCMIATDALSPEAFSISCTRGASPPVTVRTSDAGVVADRYLIAVEAEIGEAIRSFGYATVWINF